MPPVFEAFLGVQDRNSSRADGDTLLFQLYRKHDSVPSFAVGKCIAEGWAYVFSFFCVTDVIGTLSMLFEISFLLGDAGKVAAQADDAASG
eukprot:1333922-Amphidinium_carterae.2